MPLLQGDPRARSARPAGERPPLKLPAGIFGEWRGRQALGAGRVLYRSSREGVNPVGAECAAS
jgi:hypothetical protein